MVRPVKPTDTVSMVIDKVDRLAAEVKALRVKIQTVQTLMTEFDRCWQGIDTLSKQSSLYRSTIVQECENWANELGNRYTFLLNLRLWLAQEGHIADLEDEIEKREAQDLEVSDDPHGDGSPAP